MSRTNWQSLSALVGRMHQHIGRTPARLPLRERAAMLAAYVHGPHTVAQAPALINVAALALSMQRLTVHRISAGAVRMVHETDLHSLPGEPPRLLRGPWILETRDPAREWLFGNTANLAGYPLEDAIFLVGLDWPDGIRVARWVPRWGEVDLEAGMPTLDTSPMIDDVSAHHEWAREAARFALVLGLHLQAEGTPVQTKDEGRGRGARSSHGKASGSRDWVVRRVYLDRITRSPEAGSAPASRDAAEGLTEDRIAAVVPVRGHLRRQRYGPKGSLRKWVYVGGYEARRWIAPRPLRVEVRTTERQ